jgi:hypothetical protein
MDLNISLEPIGEPNKDSSDIVEISQTGIGLRIIVRTNGANDSDDVWFEYFFDRARGFRVLDEGDLIPFWRSQSYKPAYALHRVDSGGWLEQEKMSGNLTTTLAVFDNVKEWLITSGMDCVNVISANAPQIRKFT